MQQQQLIQSLGPAALGSPLVDPKVDAEKLAENTKPITNGGQPQDAN